MWGKRAFRSLNSLVVVSLLLTTFNAAMAAKSKKSRTAEPAPAVSTREQALQVMDAVPQSPQGTTPQIMMPLNDEYKTVVRRSWEWMLEAGLSQRKLDIPVPTGSLGPAGTGNLSDFTFFEFGAGLSKNFSSLNVSLLGRGATTVKQTDFALPSGSKLPIKYQWISYGLEPRITWNFSGRTSLLASVSSEQVSFVQSSSQSELIQGTQTFRENAARLGLQYDFDGNSYALATLKNYSNAFSSGQAASVGVGARW